MVQLEAVLLLVKVAVAGLVIVSLLVFVVFPLFRALAADPGNPDLPGRTALKEVEEELEIPTSKQEGITPEQILKLARRNPHRTTQLVRSWIHEKK